MEKNLRNLPLLLFLFIRLPLLLALPFSGLIGYGDLLHFHNLASIPGLPYLDYWVEYPPGFAFLNEFLNSLAGGVEHTHIYLLVLLLFAADIGSVFLFQKLIRLVFPANSSLDWRSLLYAGILAGLPYSWWYFDSFTVFFLLLALYTILSDRLLVLGGITLGLGILLKIFPILMLPALLRHLNIKKTIIISIIALLVFLIPLGILYLISPDFTRASLDAISARGSHETLWALIDGNYIPGGFGPLVERLTPEFRDAALRNPAVIPPALTLIIFGMIGFYLWLKYRLATPCQTTAFIGLTMVIFFIWSPAWSVQWVLYLLPFILLVIPASPGLLVTAILILVNLIEWPLMMSRGMFETLPATILLRLLLLLFLGGLFFQQTKNIPTPGI